MIKRLYLGYLKFKVSVGPYSCLRRWHELAYSKLLDGAFCKHCVLFSLNYRGAGNHLLA